MVPERGSLAQRALQAAPRRTAAHSAVDILVPPSCGATRARGIGASQPSPRREARCEDKSWKHQLAALASSSFESRSQSRALQHADRSAHDITTYLIERHHLENGLGDEQIIGRLQKVRCFCKMPYSELKTLYSRGTHRMYPRYSVIMREGSLGSYFFVLLHGRARCTSESQGNDTILNAGASFSEQALLVSSVVRDSTIVAEEDCYTMMFSARDVAGLALELGEVREQVVSQFMRSLNLFQTGLAKMRRSALARLMDVVEYDIGGVVFTEGDEASVQSAVYFLVDGIVCFTKLAASSGKYESVGVCAAGDEHPWFGEQVLTSYRPRNLTATCKRPTKVLVLRAPQFYSFLELVGGMSVFSRSPQGPLKSGSVSGQGGAALGGPM